MSVPYKLWFRFNKATLEGFYSGAGNTQADWTDKYRSTCRLGAKGNSKNTYWYGIFKPIAGEKFESLEGLNQIVDVQMDVILFKIRNDLPITSIDVVQGFVKNSNAWLYHIVSGKYYDGENAWDAYPPQQHASYNNPTIDTSPDIFGREWKLENVNAYFYSYRAAAGVEANRYQADFFRNGAHFRLNNYVPSFPVAGKTGSFSLEPMIMVVRFFNPIVNLCKVDGVARDPLWVPTTGGIEFKLVGLGFNNNDDELDGEGDSRLADWLDEFSDGVRASAWTDEANNGTIVESGDVLTMAVAGGVNGNWTVGTKNAPFSYIAPTEDTITVITKLNSYTVNDDTQAGLIVANTFTIPDGAGGYCLFFARVRNDGAGRNGLSVIDAGKANLAYVAVTTLPIWLRMVITGSGAGGTIVFDYSTDGTNWTNLYTENNFTWDYVGVYGRNTTAPWNAISAPFEFFGYYGEAGRWGDLVDVIEFWKQQDARRAVWRDDFDDGVIGARWSTDSLDANRTVVESGGVLTIGVAVNTDARWISSVNKAPKLYQDAPSSVPFEVVAKLNSFTLNDKIDVGLWIGYYDGVTPGKDHYHVVLRRYDGVGEGMQVQGTLFGDLDGGATSGDLPLWLKIAVDESNNVRFYYSKDGSVWVQLERSGSPMVLTNWFTTDMQIGLMVSSDSDVVHGGCQAPFEYFEIDSGGAPYATLVRTDGDFTVDSNVQITIPANKFPNLEKGSYILRVIKERMDFSPRNDDVDVWGWAGDWRAAISGLVSEGERISIEARDAPPVEEPREKGGSIILVECEKKDFEDNITKEYWSFEDVRAPDKFYEGIITEVSSFKRGIDDKSGLFKVADMTIKMTNHNKKFSKLLASYLFKSQKATCYQAFIDEKEHDKREIVSMIVEDYNMKGIEFEMILKDVSQKYFKKNIPTELATKKRFPRIHESFIGEALPDILGEAQLTIGEEKGAVEALYVDTKNYTYLAAGGRLHDITAVYSDNVLQTHQADYFWQFGDGYTFIRFETDQEDKKITFNCEGYPYFGWGSENDYVQNPAYICCYVLMKLMGVPLDFIDMGSVEEMATLYSEMGFATAGKLICQERESAMEIFRELLFSFGMKCWISKSGAFTFGRKDMSAFEAETILFEQVDIFDSIYRKMGFKGAVTGSEVEWDYIPIQNLYKGSKKYRRDDEDNDEDEDEIITSDDPLTPRRFRPLDDAVDVAPKSAVGVVNSIGIMFNRAPNKNTGTIRVYDSNDNLFDTVKVASNKVQIVGRMNRRVRIDLAKVFKTGKSYYVKIGGKCFYDSELNYYEGITDKTTWNFTVGGATPAVDPPERSCVRRQNVRRIRRGERLREDSRGEIWICPRLGDDEDEGEAIPAPPVDEDNSGDSSQDGVGGQDARYGEELGDSIVRRGIRGRR